VRDFKHIDQDIRANVKRFGDQKIIFQKNSKSGNWEGISWNKMLSQVESLASSLLTFGIEKGSNVAIFSQNSPNWIISDIAIMSLGAVTVPIYATNSSKEASYIINDAQIQVIFVGDQLIYDRLHDVFDQLPSLKLIVAMNSEIELKSHSIHIGDFMEKTVNRKGLDAAYAAGALNDLASIIYTSGTTGEPKGVMLDHENFLDSLTAHDAELEIKPHFRSLSILPLSHIYERSWVFFCLHRGIEVYFNENPREMAAVLLEVKPHVMCTVPRMFEKIYGAIQDKRNDGSALVKGLMDWALKVGDQYYNDHLRLEKKPSVWLSLNYKIANALVFKKLRGGFGGEIQFTPCGGAPLSGDLVRFFYSFGLRIICGYGLTETTATASLFGKTKFDFSSAGRAIQGTELKIGPNDEVWIKGPGVMRGYYKKPEETAKVMEGDWFKSGDAGRIDQNGYLTITDRIKDLMKTSGGKYIAPQKLEMKLVSDEMIEQIAVIGDNRNFVTALAVPSFENLKKYAEKHKINYHGIEDLIENSEIIKMMQRRFEDLQQEFSGFEKIKKFTLLPQEFTIETGEITSTLKLKRKVIQDKYKKLIDCMYKKE